MTVAMFMPVDDERVLAQLSRQETIQGVQVTGSNWLGIKSVVILIALTHHWLQCLSSHFSYCTSERRILILDMSP
jgi:hypothetical protein